MAKRQSKKNPSTPGLMDHLIHLPIEGPGYDDMQQLYTWTFEDALKAQEDWKSRNIRGRGPLFRWIGAQQLKDIYEEYRTKKGAAIIEALHICALNSLPLPRWCELAFLAAYRKVRQYRAKSWDDVFDRPHPKGTHLEAKRQEWEKSLSVYMRIKELKQNDPSIAIDGALFEKVGKEFGRCKTLIEEYYYKEKHKHQLFECPNCGDRERKKSIFTETVCPHCGKISTELELKTI